MNVRANDQLRVPPPGTQREPTDASAPPSCDRVAQAHQVRRVVREVGVHLEHVVVVARERPGKALEVGGAQAALARAMQDAYAAWEFLRQPLRDLAGAVWRVVVHHQHFEVVGLAKNGGDDRLEVFPLVVRGQDDQRSGGGRDGGRHELSLQGTHRTLRGAR